MLAVVGTIPEFNFPLVAGEVTLDGRSICINGHRIDVKRGTPALLTAAVNASLVLQQPPPFAFLVGDIGTGQGSRLLYEYLIQNLAKFDFDTIAFHYLMPDIDRFNSMLSVIDKIPRRPVLVADAGGMYAAKMSGQAQRYNLFTPDVGELAFLADETAPHPFYTRGFILHEENQVPDLIKRTYAYDNASSYLLVKGKMDYVATKDGIMATVDYPNDESMEAIGGTGDTLTGIVIGLISSGIKIDESCVLAAKANRLAGHYTSPTPATQVIEIIGHIPHALDEILAQKYLHSPGYNRQ